MIQKDMYKEDENQELLKKAMYFWVATVGFMPLGTHDNEILEYYKKYNNKYYHPLQQPMAENRRKTYTDLELVKPGYANGISMQLDRRMKDPIDPQTSLSDEEKQKIINEASIHYGQFLTALGCDWENDPNSKETPTRVAKSYVNDLWRGRYESMSDVTSFPSDGYGGMIIERNIPMVSMCSHHHQTIRGVVHIGYVSNAEGRVIGLSKLNRIVELFARRGAIQEQLTSAICNAIDKVCEGNLGVIVTIVGTHNCVSCRGVKHQGASMVTTEATGVFKDNNNLSRGEFFESIKINSSNHSVE